MRPDLQMGPTHSTGLVEVLDRVLDKGLVIAGDVRISLAEVELLTIRVRLIVCSIDKAQEIGLDWWKYDHHFAPSAAGAAENDALAARIRLLEQKVSALSGGPPAVRSRAARPPARTPARRK